MPGSASPAEVAGVIRRYWAGRRVIMVADHLNGGMKALAEELRNNGATLSAVVLNTARPRTAMVAAEHLWSCAEHGVTMSHGQFEQWLADPSAELLGWLDSIDPGRACVVVGTTYTRVGELGGRPVHGRWRDEWALWEDKTRIDELWRAAGVPSPPYTVTDVDDPVVPEIAADLDAGLGVVLAADASHGVLGSSHGLRWVRDRGELCSAVNELTALTSRLRVAAFVPGVPCSTLAMVLPDGVAVFDPFEIVTLREPGSGRLVYGGTSTWWRPDPGAAADIREHTWKVGEVLAGTLDYVGMYSVDGVLGENGFLATELNPRHVSGLGLRAGWPGFPTRLFNRALQEGVPEALTVPAREVEEVFRETVRRVPSCSVWVPVPGLPDGPPAQVRVPAMNGEQIVRYRAQQGGAWLLSAEPLEGDGALGPAAAGLATLLGPVRLLSFADDSMRSSSRTPAAG